MKNMYTCAANHHHVVFHFVRCPMDASIVPQRTCEGNMFRELCHMAKIWFYFKTHPGVKT